MVVVSLAFQYAWNTSTPVLGEERKCHGLCRPFVQHNLTPTVRIQAHVVIAQSQNERHHPPNLRVHLLIGVEKVIVRPVAIHNVVIVGDVTSN
jgi:hypothetical protein